MTWETETAPGLMEGREAMNSLLWYPWHANKWLGSATTRCMSLEERGAYRELLDWQWQCQGYLPEDIETLSRIAGFDVSKYPNVLNRFPAIDGKRANKVLLEIWKDQQRKYSNRVECAEKSHRSRRKNIEVEREGEEDPPASASHIAKHNALKEPDSSFWDTVTAKYTWVNIPVERAKMETWLSLPKNRNRKLTPRFVLNWLNKVEAPLSSTPHDAPKSTDDKLKEALS